MNRPIGIVCQFCNREVLRSSFAIHTAKCESIFESQHSECTECGRRINNSDYELHRADCKVSPRSKAAMRKQREALIRAAEEAKRPRCSECEKKPAALKCGECDQILCTSCDASLHRKGTRAEHSRSALPGCEKEVEKAAAASAAAAAAGGAGPVMDGPAMPEEEAAPESGPACMSECPTCHRNFATDRIGVHERICKKLANKAARKPVIPKIGSQLRTKGTEFAQYLNKDGTSRLPEPEIEKNDRWRLEREQFRQLIEANVPAEALAEAEQRREEQKAALLADILRAAGRTRQADKPKPAELPPARATPPPETTAAPQQPEPLTQPVRPVSGRKAQPPQRSPSPAVAATAPTAATPHPPAAPAASAAQPPAALRLRNVVPVPAQQRGPAGTAAATKPAETTTRQTEKLPRLPSASRASATTPTGVPSRSSSGAARAPSKSATRATPPRQGDAGGSSDSIEVTGRKTLSAGRPRASHSQQQAQEDRRRARESAARLKALEAAEARATGQPTREEALERARERVIEGRSAVVTTRDRLAALSAGRSTVDAGPFTRASGVRSEFTDRAVARARGKTATAALSNTRPMPPTAHRPALPPSTSAPAGMTTAAKAAPAPRAVPRQPTPPVPSRASLPASATVSATATAHSQPVPVVEATRTVQQPPRAPSPAPAPAPVPAPAPARAAQQATDSGLAAQAAQLPAKKVTSMEEYLEREKLRRSLAATQGRRPEGEARLAAIARASVAASNSHPPAPAAAPAPASPPAPAARRPQEGVPAPQPKDAGLSAPPTEKAGGTALFVPAGPAAEGAVRPPPQLSGKPEPRKKEPKPAAPSKLKPVLVDGKLHRILDLTQQQR